jgi:hypothetical protein
MRPTAQELDKCRFASTVLSQEAAQLAAVQRQGNVIECDRRSIAPVQIGYLEDWIGRIYKFRGEGTVSFRWRRKGALGILLSFGWSRYLLVV